MNYIFASTGDLEQQINSLSIRVVMVSALALVILLSIATLTTKKKYRKLKLPLFSLITFVIVASTATLFGSTVYLNVSSDSGGPVHWHADIEYWVCGVQVELRDPSGFLSNKIGTSTLHEHNDQRIHLEGVVVEKEVDASLGKFMRVIGGSISATELNVPIAERVTEDFIDGDHVDPQGASKIDEFISTDAFGMKTVQVKDGQNCDDSEAKVQTFVYSTNKDTKTYSQRKLEQPDAYVYAPESVVPPADCIIVEFATAKSRTDKLCEQYGVRDDQRCVEFGVESFTPKLCNMKEVPATSGETE